MDAINRIIKYNGIQPDREPDNYYNLYRHRDGYSHRMFQIEQRYRHGKSIAGCGCGIECIDL